MLKLTQHLGNPEKDLKDIDKIGFVQYNMGDESYPLAFISVADTLGARSQERGVSETLRFTAA